MQFLSSKIALLALAICGVFSACQVAQKGGEDALVYTAICKDSSAKNVHKQLCYIHFQGENADLLNQNVVALIIGDSLSKLQETPPFKELFESYAEDAKEMNDPDLTDEMSYEEIDSVMVSLQSENLWSLVNNGYAYHGGAHGAQYVAASNFDPNTAKQYAFIDFFKPNVMTDLLKIGEDCFRKQYLPEMELKPDAPLNDQNGFWFGGVGSEEEVDNKFYLSETYYFTPEGISFVYQQYEIGPYAIGMPTFKISYSQLKPFLNSKFSYLAK